jgi:hypothetical protein
MIAMVRLRPPGTSGKISKNREYRAWGGMMVTLVVLVLSEERVYFSEGKAKITNLME